MERLYDYLFKKSIYTRINEEGEDISPRFVMVIAIAFIIILCLNVKYATSTVSGWSMYPTFSDGDLIVGEKVDEPSDLDRYDIITCVKDGFFYNELLVKRIIGVPGDYIEIKDNKVYLNDEELKEEYLPEGTKTYGLVGKFVVPDGKYFILGDNREHSSDGRVFGYIDFSEVKTVIVYHLARPELFRLNSSAAQQ